MNERTYFSSTTCIVWVRMDDCAGVFHTAEEEQSSDFPTRLSSLNYDH